MLCRICLTDVTPLVGIFSEDGIKHQLAEKIRICLQIQVHRDDCFPDKVCCKCFMSVNDFFSFWKKAKESFNLLQKLQKDVNLKQSAGWPKKRPEDEEVVMEPTPDIIDIIDMETTLANRAIAEVLKQGGDVYTGDIKVEREKFSSSLPRDDTPSRYVQYQDAFDTKPPVQSNHNENSWKHFNEEQSSVQQMHTRNDDDPLNSKPNQFFSKQFSFGSPSMAFDFPKEIRENPPNSWETLHGNKSQSKLHIAEKEREHFSNSFSFSRKSANSEDLNPTFESKTHNSGSQQMFSANDECCLPNIPLSLFSLSDDKKQMSLEIKKSLEPKDTESLICRSPNVGTGKENYFLQKTNEIEMTPRSKVMKMLHREMW